MAPTLNPVDSAFEVRFASLFHEGRAMAFPCDASGRVELDALPSRARDNYLGWQDRGWVIWTSFSGLRRRSP
jgi:hypothetical protein